MKNFLQMVILWTLALVVMTYGTLCLVEALKPEGAPTMSENIRSLGTTLSNISPDVAEMIDRALLHQPDSPEDLRKGAHISLAVSAFCFGCLGLLVFITVTVLEKVKRKEHVANLESEVAELRQELAEEREAKRFPYHTEHE